MIISNVAMNKETNGWLRQRTQSKENLQTINSRGINEDLVQNGLITKTQISQRAKWRQLQMQNARGNEPMLSESQNP